MTGEFVVNPGNFATSRMITTQDSNRLMEEEDWDCGCVVEDCALFATDFLDGQLDGHQFSNKTVCNTHAPDVVAYPGSYGFRDGKIYRKGRV
jgi:hypothetical protein